MTDTRMYTHQGKRVFPTMGKSPLKNGGQHHGMESEFFWEEPAKKQVATENRRPPLLDRAPLRIITPDGQGSWS